MKLRSNLVKHFVALLMTFGLLLPSALPVMAQVNIQEQYNKTLNASKLGSGGDTTSTNILTAGLGSAVNAFLALIGVATFALVVYAGALWILAAGDEGKIDQAKGILKGSVIGLVIIFASYAIVNFALTTLRDALSGRVGGG